MEAKPRFVRVRKEKSVLGFKEIAMPITGTNVLQPWEEKGVDAGLKCKQSTSKLVLLEVRQWNSMGRWAKARTMEMKAQHLDWRCTPRFRGCSERTHSTDEKIGWWFSHSVHLLSPVPQDSFPWIFAEIFERERVNIFTVQGLRISSAVVIANPLLRDP